MSWTGVALLGGIVGVDATSLGQVMISRPLVAAALAGLVVGHPVAGVLVGLVLETFALAILPIGAARYPEGGTAAVAATAAYGLAVPAGQPASLELVLLAVVVALLWERVTGLSVTFARRVNEALAANEDGHLTSGAALELRQVYSVAFDFARAAAVTVTGAAVGAAVVQGAATTGVLPAGVAAALLTVAGTTMVGAGLTVFGGLSERRLALGLGLVVGLGLLVAT